MDVPQLPLLFEASPVIILYEHPLSPYSQKCRIALAEKGVPFELRLPKKFASIAIIGSNG